MSMRVGLQMYTVRNMYNKDPLGTLEKVSDVGYKTVELVNHRANIDPGSGIGIPANKLKAKADELGIKIIGGQVMPESESMVEEFYKQEDTVKSIIEYYGELGSSSISIPIDYFRTKDYLLERCSLYNKIGKVCNEFGMRLLYHNHYHDFQFLDGKVTMDLFLENTDPEYVGIELDTYWTMRGAYDPVEKIREYGKRIDVIHQKDFPLKYVQYLNAWAFLDQKKTMDSETFRSVMEPEYFIEIGDGIMKIQSIIDACNEFNIGYMLVEQDFSTLSEIDSIKRSLSNLKKMRDLTWD